MPPLPAPPKGNHQKMIEQIYETVLLDDISASSCLMVGGGGGCLATDTHRVLSGLHVWDHALGDAGWFGVAFYFYFFIFILYCRSESSCSEMKAALTCHQC